MKRLIDAAKEARENAYVPYSDFHVGAALLLKNGAIITGCNVENSSYGLSNCAERTALFKAVSEGVKDFVGLAVVANTDEVVAPCGACRQVMIELCSPTMDVWLCNTKGDVVQTTVEKLLPLAFTRGVLHG